MKAYRMRCKVSAMFLAGVLMITGCGGKLKTGSDPANNNEIQGNSVATAPSEFSFLEDEQLVWQDNRLDDYYATISMHVAAENVEGTIQGGRGGIYLSENGCVFFRNHLYSSYKNNWSGVNGYTLDGEEYSLKIEIDPDQTGLQVDALGMLSGKKGYVAFWNSYGKSNTDIEQWFYVLDEKFQVVHRTKPKEPYEKQIDEIVGDSKGNFHIRHFVSDTKTEYEIYSSEGEHIFSEVVPFGAVFRCFDGGRVCICGDTTSEEFKFCEADLASGKLRDLTVSKEKPLYQDHATADFIYCVLPIDDNAYLWCNKECLFFYILQEDEKTCVYKWANHGLIADGIRNVYLTSDGTLELVYQDKEGNQFIVLKPNDHKEELKMITIAVSKQNKETYLSAAAYFNKKYPQYHVDVKADYEELPLLTQLGAGTGPVLVDTALTGFEALENLWQPLDGFLEQTGLINDLIPETLNLGKINGKTLGIVTCFRIDTLIVKNDGPEDWDYKEFLDAVEAFDKGAFTYRFLYSDAEWREQFFRFLQLSPEENYYLNLETDEMIFGTTEFTRLLKVAEKARYCPACDDGKALAEGEALFEWMPIFGIPDIVRLRIRLEAEGERAIGYPTRNGARHVMAAIDPLAMRSTATEEEKEIAYTFLKVYLSKDAMMQDDRYFKVRKDALEQQLRNYDNGNNRIKEEKELMKEWGLNPNTLSTNPDLLWDKDVEFLEGLIRNSIPGKAFPTGLQTVFDEEFGEYLDGKISGSALDDHLRNRVWLYLQEN